MDVSKSRDISLKELPTRELKSKRHKVRKESHTIPPVRLRLKSSNSVLNTDLDTEKYFSDRSVSSSPDNVQQDISPFLPALFNISSHMNSLPSSPLTNGSNNEPHETFSYASSLPYTDQVYDQPLDMSRKRPQQSNSAEFQISQQKQLRPSVITYASTLLRTQCNLSDVDHQICTRNISNNKDDNSTDSHKIKQKKRKDADVESNNVRIGRRREIVSVASCDPVIDEHFRRSLGKDYQHVFSKSPCNSVSLTVDDHFAKALGETWHQIQQSKSISKDTGSSHASNSLQASQTTQFLHPPPEILS